MADRWKSIWLAGWRFRRIFASDTVDLIQIFGFGVIRLEVFVLQRPGRRNAAVVSEFSKILLSKSQERGAVKFRVTANEIVGARHKFISLGISPRFDIVIAPFIDHGARIPILFFSRHEIATFEKENLLTGWRQSIRKRSASRPTSNDDDIVVICAHGCTSLRRCPERVDLFPIT